MDYDIALQSLILGITSLILVLACHTYLHAKKHGKEFQVIRTLFLLIGLIGLLILLLKPSVTITTPSHNIILATDNTTNLQVPSNVKKTTSIHQLLNATEHYDTVIINGDGLIGSDLKLLDSFNIKFKPSKKLCGITYVDVPIVKEKETYSLRGKINQQQPQKLNLELSDGKILETKSDQEGYFTFQITSRSPGYFTYKLSVQYPDTTIIEDLPIEVLPSEKWNLLALSSAPSFELNYLKNYWVKLGNGFSLKQKVSNDRFKETFLNNPKIALDKIDSKTLNKFNFLLLDSNSWNDLKDTARKLILNYVASGRIGLLFMDIEKGDVVKKLDYIKITNDREVVLDDLNIKITQNNMPQGFRTIRLDNLNPAGIRNYGLGGIGIMTIPETYRFLLANENTTYQNLWAKVFSNLYIAPSEEVIFKNPKWNWEHKDLQINIYSRAELQSGGTLNSTTEVSLIKTKDQLGMYSVNVKPNVGWNSLSINSNMNTHKFFTHSANSWQAMKQSHLHATNHAAASESRIIPHKENHKKKELPFYWGLIISLLGFGSLWLHERIYA